MAGIRIGQGFDVHRFAIGRKLILGGVEIPHDRGLDGHSDADVLLHAVTDAVLGAIGEGDIGRWFPDTDPQWKGADSLELLRTVWRHVRSQGWALANCDSIVLAERPKIAPHIAAIKERLCSVFEVEPACVGVKATTTERLGFVGREEGIAAMAVVLLEQAS